MSVLRRISSWVHLYGGLALGGLLIVISVSGSALVFEDALEAWLHPSLHHVTPSDTRAPLDEVFGAVEEVHPDATPWIVDLPTAPTEPAVVRLGPEAPSVYVDPYRATILGERPSGEGVVNTVVDLHVQLLAGRTGSLVVGASGLLLVLLTVTGLVLWWPRRLTALGEALRVMWRQGAVRFNYDLHRAGGFYTVLFLLLTALTGSAFIFYPTTQQIFATATATAPWPPPAPTTPERGSDESEAVSYQAAMRAATEALPEGEPTFLYVPQEPNAPVTIRLRTPPEWHPNGSSFVYTRPSNASVLRVDDARTAPWSARVLQTFYPLHIGAVGGLFVKWLYVILGLAPAILSVTGTMIWYQRWRTVAPAEAAPNATEENTRPVVLPADRPSQDDPSPIPRRP
ncbi:PepSY-associated TM helix domain-containing protein [Salinibacter altiplanensis]|uniref:PepSY-associated TM helix domain-containing protein n=1 Tax=Salinibacter altiplanensis TaxID=1803181 RepID=UPI000C9F39BE|nr:PepSY-associated TM helix domain-containing protein [Salinibacter altiplanensis]